MLSCPGPRRHEMALDEQHEAVKEAHSGENLFAQRVGVNGPSGKTAFDLVARCGRAGGYFFFWSFALLLDQERLGLASQTRRLRNEAPSPETVNPKLALSVAMSGSLP